MSKLLNRRTALRLGASQLLSAGVLGSAGELEAKEPASRAGAVAGHPEGVQAGMEVLAKGGNAVDAAVTAALVASVVAVQGCGPGGYGGHMVIATGDGKRVTAIDFNTAAPRAARPNLFPLDKSGQVRGAINMYGWLAAGVPGTLAGLQLALDRHGTRSFREAVQPALHYARDGFAVSTSLASAIRTARAALAAEPDLARLLLPRGEPPRAGDRLRNPELAGLLERLAKDNSVDSFYRGEIARQIAAAFRQHGGLVTAADLAAYRAREVEPVQLGWRGLAIHTAPLTAGGATMLQALHILKLLGWEKRDPAEPQTTQLRLEALRLAWDDRLKFFGDPEATAVPWRRLLSEEHARAGARRVEEAVRRRRPVSARSAGRSAHGTIHLSAVDRRGMMVALTLTHGGNFGARVLVSGLGLILGHGMSRFDPRPAHPNAPGPGKRPLHNMCPTIVCRNGRPLLALGGRGGRRIPNAVCDVLLAFAGRQLSLEQAVAAPRLHTEGDTQLVLEPAWPQAHAAYLQEVGYTIRRGPSAVVHAVTLDPATREARAAGR